MEYMNFLKNRRSVRNFKEESLSLETINKVKELMKNIEETGLDEYYKFNLVDNPGGFYEDLVGKAGYSGVMIQAPEYVVIEYKEMEPMNILQGAVGASELITQLMDIGLGTCWLTLGRKTDEVRDKYFGLVGNNIRYALAFGIPADKRPFSGQEFSTRKPVNQIVFSDHQFKKPAIKELDSLDMLDLFEALRFAPSNRNQQPWKFVIDKGLITLYLDKGYSFIATLTDGGIIMYYFQKLAESRGLNGKWKIDLQDTGDYWKVGSYNL